MIMISLGDEVDKPVLEREKRRKGIAESLNDMVVYVGRTTDGKEEILYKTSAR